MLLHVLALLRIVEIRETRVVELQILAAALAELDDLLRVHRTQVVPELFHARIHAHVDRRAAAAVVDHARRGNRQLRRAVADDRFQELEVVAEDAAVEVQLARHAQAGRREIDVALVAVEVHGDVLLDLLHAADLVHEVHVPRRAAELAVGDALQADVLLHLHDGADRIVLDCLQLRGADATLLVLLACAQQLLRPQQAADVIGAKRRLRELHDCSCAWSCFSSSCSVR